MSTESSPPRPSHNDPAPNIESAVRCKKQAALPAHRATILFVMTIEEESLARSRALHRRVVVIDTHMDTTQWMMRPGWDVSRRQKSGHVDLPRLREGGIDCVFFAVFVPGSLPPRAGVDAARRQLAQLHLIVEQHPEHLTLARCAEEVRRAKATGKIAVLPAIEGGYLIEESLDVLREFRRMGAAYMTLTHALHTTWADSSGIHQSLEPLHHGLTAFGREVILEMNRIGMMVDVSHVSDETFRDALETSAAPLLASHSSCRAVSPHRRNLSDEMMRAIAETGGVVQINFNAWFIDKDFPAFDYHEVERHFQSGLDPAARPTCAHITPLSVLVDHFDHALQTIGPDHVGIGSDFDGVSFLPAGMEDCSRLPHLTAALLQRGYNEADLTKVLGGNVLRVMEACAARAAELSGGVPKTDPAIHV